MKLNIFVFLLIWHTVLCQWGHHKPPRFCSRKESALIAAKSKIAIKEKVDVERITKLYNYNKIKLSSFANEVLRDIKDAAFSHVQDTQSAMCFIELAAEAKQVRSSHVVALRTCYYELLKEHQLMVRAYHRAMLDINRCSKKKQSCRDTRECCDRVHKNFGFEDEFNVLVGSMKACFSEKYKVAKDALNNIKSRIGSCSPTTVPPTGSPSTITSLETTASQATNTEGVTVAAETTGAAETTVTLQATAFPTVNN